jgi:hypothetical protein
VGRARRAHTTAADGSHYQIRPRPTNQLRAPCPCDGVPGRVHRVAHGRSPVCSCSTRDGYFPVFRSNERLFLYGKKARESIYRNSASIPGRFAARAATCHSPARPHQHRHKLVWADLSPGPNGITPSREEICRPPQDVCNLREERGENPRSLSDRTARWRRCRAVSAKPDSNGR